MTARRHDVVPQFDVVAIGASAGGVEALHAVAAALPADFPVPVLIVQHMGPRHKSLLAGLLGRRCRLRVKQAVNDEEMRGATFDHPDWGAAWRQHDLDMLKSAEFQKFLKDQKFVMVCWKDLAKALPAEYGK